MPTARVRFEGDGEFEASAPEVTLLALSRRNGVPHVSVCGGKGRCSTCRVIVLDGGACLAPRNPVESALAKQKGLAEDVRLACQTRAGGDLTVRRLVHDDVDQRLLLGERQAQPPREVEIAILFSDVRGFTTFSEAHLPYDVVHILNRYFYAMGSAILAEGGHIDKYMGDGIMALFGLDGRDPSDACRRAIAAAQAMSQRLELENEHLAQQFDTRFEIGIGIHVGTVVVGEMGHPDRMQFTAIGDAVNVAARIESATKEVAVATLVSDDVRARVPELVGTEPLVSTGLKGKSGSFALYGLRAPSGAAS